MGVGEGAREVGPRGVLSLTLRPHVPMGHFVGVPFVCALAAAEGVEARIRWPYEVVGEDGSALVRVRCRAGYDEGGMYAACDLDLAPGVDPEALEARVRGRVEAWSDAVSAGRAAAGPLAPVLGDFFDLLLGMGEESEVVRGGRAVARGTLAGVDVWGRATVRLPDGRELECAPEQVALRPVS